MSQDRNDAEELAEQIAALRPSLQRYARSLTGDEEEAADLTQAALAAALLSASSVRSRTNLRAWTFRILHNLHLNRRRSAARASRWLEAGGLDDDIVAANADPCPVEHEVLNRLEVNSVLAAFRELPRGYAIPLYLSAVEELSYAQVAKLLEVPVGTVMSRIYRGRRLLLARLSGEER
ncbi:MAG TPA: RNA polymerase sigma factor [Candidatus Saccharimonadales bacterium]|nr:RNA polymerase sigma factor [Candidatus Saccharimonadales bacterium]